MILCGIEDKPYTDRESYGYNRYIETTSLDNYPTLREIFYTLNESLLLDSH